MSHNTTPNPTGLASGPFSPARRPRLRSFIFTLLLLAVASSGLLGYQIGRGETTRLRAQSEGRDATYELLVYSMQQEQVPAIAFDRLSLYGQVLQSGSSLRSGGATAVLGREGAALMSAQGGVFSFPDLEQVAYTLSADVPGEGSAEVALNILKTQEADKAQLNQGTDGTYTLIVPPSASYARLDLRLENGAPVLALNEEEQIPLKAYQFWQRDTDVPIFTQRTGSQVITGRDGNSLFAPGSGGSFIFAVENPNYFPVEYAITLNEENTGPLQLPMRYRIKEDVLHAGDEQGWNAWSEADDIRIPYRTIQPGDLSYYTLQWMWDSGDNALDTAIGTHSEEIGYRLRINVMQTIPDLVANIL